jgi:hypothetical protein
MEEGWLGWLLVVGSSGNMRVAELAGVNNSQQLFDNPSLLELGLLQK